MNNNYFHFNDWWFVRMLDRNCQRIQRNIGLDCFFFAKLFMWIAMIYSVLSPFIRFYMDFHMRGVNMEFITWLLATPLTSGQFTSATTLLCFIRLFSKDHSITEIEKTVKMKIMNGLMNDRVRQLRPGFGLSLGIITCCFFGFIIFSLFPSEKNLTTWILLFGLKSLYPYYIAMALCACNPLPPKKSKLRLWLEKMSEKLKFEESPDGVPQPA